MSDGEEAAAGSSPLDRGSFTERLPTTICAEWNGYLDGMWNIMEHENKSEKTLHITTTLYDFFGNAVNRLNYALPPGGQQDLLVHGFSGRMLNSYGLVCSTQDGEAGDLDGRMVYYKQTGDSFDFAFAMPFGNGKTGSQFVPYNTYQPSFRTRDSTNLAANWIQLTNLGEQQSSGTLFFYNADGSLLGSEEVVLERWTRRDFAAHRFGPSKVGLVEWRPADSASKAALRNVRYLYDNPGMRNTFAAAFQIEAVPGSGQLLSAPVDTTQSQMSVLELNNNSALPITIDVKIYGEDGTMRATVPASLGARATQHIILNDLLGAGRKGTAQVQASRMASLSAMVMQYSRAADGSIEKMYGITARESLGSFIRGSYNTFLGQRSTLLLANTTEEQQVAGIYLVSIRGSVLTNPLLPEFVSVPAHGLLAVDLTDGIGADDYGTVTVTMQNQNALSGNLLRFKGKDYTIPTELR